MTSKFALLLLLLGSMHTHAQRAKHVVLISIDGLRPDFYLDPAFKTPNLQRLKKNGVYARSVTSVFPSITYPAHTTIVTGALPGRHGIYYNAPYGGRKGQWYWEERYINVPTLWDAVRTAGLKTGAVMWPVTVGAPIDYNFPVRRADNDQDADQLSVTLPFVTPGTLVTGFEKTLKNKLAPADFNTNNTIDVTIGNMASYIIKTYKPNLVALHFVTVDHLQHEHGRDAVEVKQAVEKVDSMIGLVVAGVRAAGIEQSTAIIITGDHGFVNSTNTFSPNSLLAQQGMVNAGDTLARFLPSGGSAFLYLKKSGDTATLKTVVNALQSLPEEVTKQFRIVDRKELDRIGANPEVALALAMSKGVVAIGDWKGPLVKPRSQGGNHGYYPDFAEIATGFIASGAGIAAPHELPSMGIKDIAPLIATLLGLPFTSPDGVLTPGIIK